MSISTLLLATAMSIAVPQPLDRPGPKVVQARATAAILEPAIVRQGKGLEERRRNAPTPQRTVQGRTILYEFQ